MQAGLSFGAASGAHHEQIADTLLDHLRPRAIVLADKAYDATHP
ncbi:hypothetical protein MesoLj113b_68730 (plasmid) [Mesorhizobium sp. 113-3-3]|nr:hypothetical protein MesoLj113b_68730 [Mesorhizobium sp. 113-3-3]